MKKLTLNNPQTRSPRESAHTYKAFFRRARGKIAGWVGGREFRARSASGAGALGDILLPGARARWQLPYLRTLTPDLLESILRDAATGTSPRREHELYALMEQTWPRLAKNLSEIKNTVVGLDWTVRQPDTDAPDAAAEDLVTKSRLVMRGDPATGTLGWEGTMRHLLDGWFRGVSMVEIDWRAGAGGILPRSTRPIPAWHFGWSRDVGQLMLYPEPGRADSAMEIPPGKFLVAVHNASGEHPSTGALLRPLVWWWCAANFSAEWLLNYAQIFGQPYRWATYARGDTAAAEQLYTIMEEMGSAAFGVGPEGTDIQFHESSRSGSDLPQAALLDRADRACDILLLGQTLTTDVGASGSRALGEVHRSVRSDIVDAAAGWLSEILNEQLIPALFTLQRGGAPDLSTLPWWEASRKQSVDTKVTAEVIEILVRAGLPIPQAWAHDILDIPAPQEGEAIIQPPQPAAPPAGDPAAFLGGLPTEARAYLLAKLGSHG